MTQPGAPRSHGLPLPSITLEEVEDRSPPQPEGFLRLVRRRMRARYPDGSSSEPFVYDEVDRQSLDATVVAAHFVDAGGRRQVFLRSALRPPAYLRAKARGAIATLGPREGLWELPAGLIEAHELSAEGLVESARRELWEETGLAVDREALRMLGESSFPSPGVIAERHVFFEVEVDPTSQREPPLDGSPLERFGSVRAVALDDALALCRDGGIEDAKTELGLRRLEERYR